jgi:F-type H+-transporting ATPase subunit gamma
MEMVATSKMRRAQQRVLASRPFAQKMNELLGHLAAQIPEREPPHPLLERRSPQHIGVVHITADRGLCGGLNSNMNRRTASFMLSQEIPVSLVTVGRKGREFMSRYGRDILADFSRLGDQPALMDTLPISHVIIDHYLEGGFDQVYLAYTQFVSTVTQRPIMQRILPVEPAPARAAYLAEYIYEPNPAAVLAELLPRFVEMQVYQAVLEHIASEHSARMVAMRNATENANELIQDLTLTYNKARQEAITKELLDIVGGAAALT